MISLLEMKSELALTVYIVPAEHSQWLKKGQLAWRGCLACSCGSWLVCAEEGGFWGGEKLISTVVGCPLLCTANQ